MGRWTKTKEILGRWRAERIRTKKTLETYRTYDRNKVALENGKPLSDQSKER